MTKSKHILLLFLLLAVNLSAQTVKDTAADESIIIWAPRWEEKFIFKDFDHQASTYFYNKNLYKSRCYGKRVYVSTVFGKDGRLKNTHVLDPDNPYCDSIAFNFIDGLTGWLPGLMGGKFIDIPFIFPVILDSSEIQARYVNQNLFDVSEEEFRRREDYYRFFNSEQYDEAIIDDFDRFKEYIAITMRDTQYIHILSDCKLDRKESITLDFTSPKSKKTHVFVRNPEKECLLYTYSLKKGKIRIPKGKEVFLLFYKEGTPPLLQQMTIQSENDTTIDLQLEKYTKGRLLDELKTEKQDH